MTVTIFFSKKLNSINSQLCGIFFNNISQTWNFYIQSDILRMLCTQPNLTNDGLDLKPLKKKIIHLLTEDDNIYNDDELEQTCRLLLSFNRSDSVLMISRFIHQDLSMPRHCHHGVLMTDIHCFCYLVYFVFYTQVITMRDYTHGKNC